MAKPERSPRSRRSPSSSRPRRPPSSPSTAACPSAAHRVAPRARRLRHLLRRQEHPGQACGRGGGRGGPGRAVRRPDRHRVHQGRAGRRGQGAEGVRQGQQGAGHQGRLHGRRALSVAEVEKIADLESREVLLSKLAGAMKAKPAQAAALFQAPASKVARLAQAAGRQASGRGRESLPADEAAATVRGAVQADAVNQRRPINVAT